MKILFLLGLAVFLWIAAGPLDDLAGYHPAADLSVWVPRIHDAFSYLWGVLMGGGGAIAVFRR
jgi:hypothetical protein